MDWLPLAWSLLQIEPATKAVPSATIEPGTLQSTLYPLSQTGSGSSSFLLWVLLQIVLPLCCNGK